MQPKERFGRYPAPKAPFGHRVALLARRSVAVGLVVLAVGGGIKEVQDPYITPSIVSNAQGAGEIFQNAYRLIVPETVNTYEEQRLAGQLIKKAKKNGEIIEAVVVNNEDPTESPRARLTPAFLDNNVATRLAPGTKIAGVLVQQVIGYLSPDYPKVWLAFESSEGGRIVFINLYHVVGPNGQSVLQANTQIHDFLGITH